MNSAKQIILLNEIKELKKSLSKSEKHVLKLEKQLKEVAEWVQDNKEKLKKIY